MAERSGGVRGALAQPGVYSLLQSALGARRVRRRLVELYLAPAPGERILDLGCGPGDLLEALPATVEYVGIDLSSPYIRAAAQRFPGRGRFEVRDARGLSSEELGKFDAVVSVGLIHHLDDAAVAEALSAAGRLLSAAGRFVSLDPGLAAGQPRTARWLMGRDRGAHVRSAAEYESLLGDEFRQVTVSVHHDLARVPYTHVVSVARKPRVQDQTSSA